MRNKDYWFKKFSKIYDNVNIDNVYYYEVLTNRIIREHALYCNADKYIFVIYYSYDNCTLVRQRRKWIEHIPISEMRKHKLKKIDER